MRATTLVEQQREVRRAAPRTDLTRRLVTAAVGVPLVLWLVWKGSLFSAALFAFGAAMATTEFYRLMLTRWWTPATATGVAAAALLPVLPAITPAHAAELAVGLVMLTSLVAWVAELPSAALPQPELQRVPDQASGAVQGVVFCALGLFWLQAIRGGPSGFEWTIAVLAVTWLNDSGAMFGGRAFGRRLLAPKVSPKKTWEGWASGAATSLVTAMVLRALWPSAFSVRDVIALTIIASVFGPLGDLIKSLLKRARGAKDAGRLLPGHGGMLDRIDALLVTAPLVALYLALR